MREDFRGGRIRRAAASWRRPTPTPATRSPTAAATLTVSGVLLRPRGRGPVPGGGAQPRLHRAVDLRHRAGPAREQDYLARAGFVVLHTDYRGHAASDPATPTGPGDPARLHPRHDQRGAGARRSERTSTPTGSRCSAGRWAAASPSTRWSPSPGLVTAAVVFAPVSSRFLDNFDRWTVAERPEAAQRLYRRFGTPAAGAGVLPRAVGAHLLRPDHRAGADPPRHRRRVLPVPRGRGPPSGCCSEAGVRLAARGLHRRASRVRPAVAGLSMRRYACGSCARHQLADRADPPA